LTHLVFVSMTTVINGDEGREATREPV
jgi:hypothetical protein